MSKYQELYEELQAKYEQKTALETSRAVEEFLWPKIADAFRELLSSTYLKDPKLVVFVEALDHPADFEIRSTYFRDSTGTSKVYYLDTEGFNVSSLEACILLQKELDSNPNYEMGRYDHREIRKDVNGKLFKITMNLKKTKNTGNN